MIGEQRFATELSTKVGDEMGPHQGKYCDYDVNQLLVEKAIANEIKLRDEEIISSNVLV